jgi:hypothetical protein
MIEGGCLCGKVRYTINGSITDVSHCHCSMCRKMHGAAFVTFGSVQKNELEWLCEAEDIVVYRSSEILERAFCKHCGSSLLCREPGEPELEYIALGTVDNDPGCMAEYHIWVDSKAPWYEISDGLPCHAEENA